MILLSQGNHTLLFRNLIELCTPGAQGTVGRHILTREYRPLNKFLMTPDACILFEELLNVEGTYILGHRGRRARSLWKPVADTKVGQSVVDRCSREYQPIGRTPIKDRKGQTNAEVLLQGSQRYLLGTRGLESDGRMPVWPDGPKPEHFRIFRRAMGIAEMHAIGSVFLNKLRVNGFVRLVDYCVGIARIEIVRAGSHALKTFTFKGKYIWNLPPFTRRASGRVMPEKDQFVLFHYMPFAQLLAYRMILIGNQGVLAIGIPLPAMIGAGNTSTFNLTTIAQVGSHMMAVCIEHSQFAVFTAKGHQILAEILHRLDTFRRNLGAPANMEPTGGF